MSEIKSVADISSPKSIPFVVDIQLHLDQNQIPSSLQLFINQIEYKTPSSIIEDLSMPYGIYDIPTKFIIQSNSADSEKIKENKLAIEYTLEMPMFQSQRRDMKMIYDTVLRLPTHENIIKYYGYFTNNSNDGKLKIEAIIGERIKLTLKDLIDKRKKKNNEFSELEMMYLINTISNGLCHLNKCLLAHNGLNAEAIGFRIPDDVDIKDLENTNISISDSTHKIIPIICDFNFLHDFMMNECDKMVDTFHVGFCYYDSTSPPEISQELRSRKKVKLDYTKADIWSLGQIMIEILGFDMKKFSSSHPKLLPADFTCKQTKVLELVKHMLAPVEERWTCQQIFEASTIHLQSL
jgi:serine/threonine protein kinase